MKLFYNKLVQTFSKDKIKDKFRNKGIKPIQFIDLYAGQEYNPEHFEGHNYPAMLVNWDIDYKIKPPVCNLTFTICYEQMRDTSNLGKNTKEALLYLDLISEIDVTLKTIQTEHTGQLKLLTEGQKLDDTVCDVYTLTYECSYSGKLPEPRTGYLKGQIENLTEKRGLYAKLSD